MRITIAYLLLPVLLAIGCRKKPDPVIPVEKLAPNVKLVFNNVVDGHPLVLNNKQYTNAHGDTFTVSSYKYYISNIQLVTEGEVPVSETNSYHLVDQQDSSSRSMTIHIPAGRYHKINFLIGVDSLRNLTGAQTGALDPAKAMFWDWNTGYIMARMEGKSPQATVKNMLAFHLAGFSGPDKALRWVTLQLPAAVVADTNKTPVVMINSDLAEWFRTPNTIDFSKMAIVGLPGPEGTQIADNYADMFTVTEVKQ